MSWTQPVCPARFAEMYPDREPVQVRLPAAEFDRCCFCQQPTNIYVRIDPTTVPYPMGE